MRRPLVLLLVLSALALGAAACDGSFGAQAASVNGTGISQHSLTSAIVAIGKDPALTCAVSGNGQVALAGVGGPSTYSSGVAASVLESMVEARLLSDEVARQGLQLSAYSRQLATAELASSFGGQSGACRLAGDVLVARLPQDVRSALVTVTAARLVLSAHLAHVSLTPAGLHEYATTHPTSSQLSCVSAIASSTEQASAALAKAVRAGVSFAALAKAHSIDATSAANGGALGCVLLAQVSPALANAVANLRVGQVSDPLAFNGAYLLLLVTSRREASAAMVATVVEQAESSPLNARLEQVFAHSRVQVNPAYGSWQKVAGSWQVVGRQTSAAKYTDRASLLTPKGA